MTGIFFGNNRVLLWNWPINCELGVEQINKRVLCVGRPMRVNEIGVGDVFFERLVAVGDAFWYVDGGAWVEFYRECLTKTIARPQAALSLKIATPPESAASHKPT